MREKLQQSIEKFGQTHPNRRIHIEKCLRHLEKYSPEQNVFERNFFDDGHFTAGVLAFNPERSKVLLMQSKKSGTWQQFWGHADGNIDLRAVALREFEEESGISSEFLFLEENIGSIDVHIVPVRMHPEHGFEPEHYHYDINFYGIVSEASKIWFDDPDVADIAWFSFDDLKEKKDLLPSGMQTMVEQYLLKIGKKYD